MSARPSRSSLDGTAWFGRPARLLQPLDRQSAADRLTEIAEKAAGEGLRRLCALLTSKAPLAAALAAVFDLSPYLRDYARRNPRALEQLFDASVEERLDALTAEIATCPFGEEVSEKSLMRHLRALKQEAQFLIGVSSLAGAAGTDDTVRRLSKVADACVRA